MSNDPKQKKTRTRGVYKRGDHYRVMWRDANGKQRSKSARTYDEAKTMKRQFDDEARNGVVRPPDGISLHEYALAWVESYNGARKRGIVKSTRDDYRRDLTKHALRHFPARTKLASVTTADVQKFLVYLDNPLFHPRPLGTRTKERILAPLSACFESARREGLILYNPVSAVVVEHDGRTGEESESMVLNREELAALLATIPAEWQLFHRVVATTGVRWSEAIAWKWKDFDEQRAILRVQRRFSRGQEDRPKSTYGRRTLPLTTTLAATLAQARDERGAGRDDLIFVSATGCRLNYQNMLRRVLKPAGVRAGVPWVGYHTFRHTAASLWFAKSMDAVQVQRRLGHHSPAFTMDTYLHLLDQHLGEALDLDDELGGRGRPMT